MPPPLRLLLPALLAGLVLGSSAGYDLHLSGAATRRGRRPSHEDGVVSELLSDLAPCPPLRVAAVFDGHDGADSALLSSDELATTLRPLLRAACARDGGWSDEALSGALRSALVELDAAALLLSGGTTAVVALLPPTGRWALAWVGDSRAYLCTAGAARQLTADHTPSAAGEAARIAAAGGRVERRGSRARLQGELAVSRALGDAAYRRWGLVAEPELAYAEALASGEALLLLSDGATEKAEAGALCRIALARGGQEEAEAAEAAGSAPAAIALPGAAGAAAPQPPPGAPEVTLGPLAARAEAVAAAALRAGSGDNVAVVLVRRADRDSLALPRAGAVVSSASGAYLLQTAIALRSGGAPEAALASEAGDDWALASAPEACAAPWSASDSQALSLSDDLCLLSRLALESGDERGRLLQLPSARRSSYRMARPLASGHFGEVWLASRGGARFVLKRIPASAPDSHRRAAARETHFGRALPPAQSLFEERFEAPPPGGGPGADLYLAFRHGGDSLARLLYGGEGGGGGGGGGGGLALRSPSAWWRKQRAAGGGALLAIFRGLLAELAAAHGAGAAHRDVKPPNVLVSGVAGGGPLRVWLCDWGSGVDGASAPLYGPSGPGAAEETEEYSPPEARFGGAAWARTVAAAQAADVWAAAVVGLELLALASPRVFDAALGQAEAAAAARAAARSGLGEAEAERLLHLRRLRSWCIAPAAAPAPACDEAALAARVAAADPTGRGLESVHLLRLLRRMLAWEPAERPSAQRALLHAAFAASAFACADGREAEWADEC